MTRLERQNFLGADSDSILEQTTVGIVGLGGGGSHIVQQLAHLGVNGYVLVDPQSIEDTNTNRLIGGTLADVETAESKVVIAERTIRHLQPNARVEPLQDRWQNCRDALKACDVIVGAVDSFRERDELERFARKHLIPYIDIGMDVLELPDGTFRITGQVIQSMPGLACLRCCNVINHATLEQEANQYGAAGSKPQVVWPNGALASTAVGLIVQLVTPWHSIPSGFKYLVYEGNVGTIVDYRQVIPALKLENRQCLHHPLDETGNPRFDIRTHLQEVEQRQASANKRPTFWQAQWQRNDFWQSFLRIFCKLFR